MKIQRTKRAWEIEGKNGDEVYYGRTPSDQEKLSDSSLKNKGIEENSRYYTKQVIVQPLIQKKNFKH